MRGSLASTSLPRVGDPLTRVLGLVRQATKLRRWYLLQSNVPHSPIYVSLRIVNGNGVRLAGLAVSAVNVQSTFIR